MNGKIPAAILVVGAVVVGAGVFYMQVYGYYERLDQGVVASQITAAAPDGTMRLLPVSEAEGIDANSSPLRWRACFTLEDDVPDPATLVPYEGATPLVGPGWFSCYDAGAVTRALESGEAHAWLSAAGVHSDVDRVIALWPDGHGVGWHQLDPDAEEPGMMD